MAVSVTATPLRPGGTSMSTWGASGVGEEGALAAVGMDSMVAGLDAMINVD